MHFGVLAWRHKILCFMHQLGLFWLDCCRFVLLIYLNEQISPAKLYNRKKREKFCALHTFCIVCGQESMVQVCSPSVVSTFEMVNSSSHCIMVRYHHWMYCAFLMHVFLVLWSHSRVLSRYQNLIPSKSEGYGAVVLPLTMFSQCFPPCITWEWPLMTWLVNYLLIG